MSSLLYVLPAQPAKNQVDVRSAGFDNGGNFIFREAIRSKLSYRSYVVCVDLGLRISVAATIKNWTTALIRHVVSVIFHSPNKKMIWINARRIVAFVKNAIREWIFIEGHVKRYSRRFKQNIVNTYSSIPMFVFRSGPKPALIAVGNIDFGPKTLNLYVCQPWERSHGNSIHL